MASAASGLPIRTTASVAASICGSSSSVPGSSSMPTETKNSTANASRIGSASEAARTLNSDRPTTRPARNAPSAIDTPKTCADDTAMPRAMASTVSVNSSRDWVRATARQQPRDDAAADHEREAAEGHDLDQRQPDRDRHGAAARAPPKIAGISTSTSTVNRSSTTSQPTAMCPVGVCSWRLSESTRTRTTVLATDSATPKTMPALRPQPARSTDERPERGGDQALDDRAGDRHALHREQVLEVELQADAEHQQDDADLGELLGDVRDRRRTRACTGRRRARPGGSRRSATASGAG